MCQVLQGLGFATALNLPQRIVDAQHDWLYLFLPALVAAACVYTATARARFPIVPLVTWVYIVASESVCLGERFSCACFEFAWSAGGSAHSRRYCYQGIFSHEYTGFGVVCAVCLVEQAHRAPDAADLGGGCGAAEGCRDVSEGPSRWC